MQILNFSERRHHVSNFPLRVNLFSRLALFGNVQGFVLDWSFILAPEERGMSLDVDEDTQDGRSDNGESHDQKGFLVVQLTKSKTKTNSRCITCYF